MKIFEYTGRAAHHYGMFKEVLLVCGHKTFVHCLRIYPPKWPKNAKCVQCNNEPTGKENADASKD